MNRKLRKLINNPAAFWADSKFNPRNSRKNHRMVKPILGVPHVLSKNSNSLNVFSDNSIAIARKTEWMVDRTVLMKPAGAAFDFESFAKILGLGNVDAFMIKPLTFSSKYALCVPATKRDDIIREIASFAYHEGAIVAYKIGANLKKPNSLGQMHSDLLGLNKADIRLTSLRHAIDFNSFWFRLEIWSDEKDYYLSPTPNHISRKLWKSTVDDAKLFREGELRDLAVVMKHSHEKAFDFDIDVVFTWVNSDDLDWRKIYEIYRPPVASDATSHSRFTSRDELKYALRSWEKNASFIRTIFVVSNCKPPEWLNLSNTKVKWIYHEEIIPGNDLPVFSSHAIETSLHKIAGLSNYFIYSNDDFLITRPTTANDFFLPNGIAKLRLEPYGNVNGEARVGDPDYLNAARNGKKLLERDFQKTTTQLHTHSPQSMRIDILNEMEVRYAEEFAVTRANKFRAIDDISVTGYLYHHYAYLSGHAISGNEQVELIQQNHNFSAKLKKLVSHKKKNEIAHLPLSVCLNDGADSHLNESWNNGVVSFLNTFFPDKSSFEN